MDVFNPMIDLATSLIDRGISVEALNNPNHPEHWANRKRLADALQQGTIELQRIEALATMAPSAYDAVKGISQDYTDLQKTMAGELGRDFENARNVILEVVKSTSSDEVRLEALRSNERISRENNETTKSLSRSHGEFFEKATMVILGGLLLVAAGGAAAYLGRK